MAKCVKVIKISEYIFSCVRLRQLVFKNSGQLCLFSFFFHSIHATYICTDGIYNQLKGFLLKLTTPNVIVCCTFAVVRLR